MRLLSLSAACLTATSLFLPCCGGYGRVGLSAAPKIVNVSSYDPKEKQRPGDSYSSSDVSALQRNGSHGLIARCGKGGQLDEKCADFLAAANRQGMLLGSYYYVSKGVSATRQADQYLARLRQITATKNLHGRKILLAGDFDTRSSSSEIVAFIDRIEHGTGVLPIIYLENSDQLRSTLATASPAHKRRIRQCPYWIALYSADNGFKTPQSLMEAYGVWNDWALWQYAGVEWKGRSIPQHFTSGPWRSPAYFGSMDRPLEHNAFNGSVAALHQFWDRHSWQAQTPGPR
jgi:hypothetical protein